ncbi:right-handed parallel beta-helix repeat-containing protein [Lederbergia sp. NSJ-179]|uniref:right-handed parallel beta-helix repeat-containing protein n=1 Tax=Lederbergia sp. NSJ-179 TaxID=2931402 RepID=UPI001FD62B27|nr:right-handed parallel beta-helix repeat-containing protein [Lederbergia sp. NSJ-179]MCJ7842501.1 right-handed parallel beta-helix repeat-containing protein [Lederbergia sp. NSJ-179]
MKKSVVVKKSGLLNRYRTIQQGIAAVEDGGIVYIESGQYQENLSVDSRKITLIGRGNVLITGTQNYPLLKTADATVKLQGITFHQKGHSNAIYVKETSVIEIEECTIEGENYPDVKTPYPALWIGLESTVKVKNSTLIAHTSNSVYIQESDVTLENCDIKGFGLYADLESKLNTVNINIKNPSSYGIYAKEARLHLETINMTGGGVVVIMENSQGYIQNLTSNHTYRDVLRIDKSEVTIEKGEIKHFCEMKSEDNKASYPGISIKNNSSVKIKDFNIHDSPFDGIQVYQSHLELSDSTISKTFMGIYIREQSTVEIDNLEVNKTEYNAISIANQSKVSIQNSTFHQCVDKHEKNYPVIFMKEQGSLAIEKTVIKESSNDAIYIAELQDAYFQDITFDAVNTGIYAHKSVVNAEQLTIKNCFKNALILFDCQAAISNSYIENNNIESTPTYEANSDVPKAVDAALAIANSKVTLNSLDIIDKTASISLRERSKVEGTSLRLSGGVFSLNSDLEVSFLSFTNLEKEAIHFKLLMESSAKVQFDDPDISILLAKDINSFMETNLIHPPHTIVQHDFASKTSPMMPTKEPIQVEMNNTESQAQEKHQVDKLIGPIAYKESMQQLLKEISLVKIRATQGIKLPHHWLMLWIQEGMDDLQPFIEQTHHLLQQVDLFGEEEFYRLSTMATFQELTQIKKGLLWIDQLENLQNDPDLVELLRKKAMDPDDEIVMIFSGTEDKIKQLQTYAPELWEKINDQVTFSIYTAEEVAEIVRQKLVTHQFVFDTSFLRQAIEENYPNDTDERINNWPEKIVEAIIQAQSERLLEEGNQQFTKEQIVSLTQMDLFKGVVAAPL